ncbi:MAG: TlpA disulfide reductase family protein [Sphingobacteriia bacterium]
MAQTKFRIEIEAPSFINDSLIISVPVIKVGLEDIYNLKLDTNANVSYFKKMITTKASVFQVKIQDNNFIEGNFLYPQPVAFQYFDRTSKQISVSSIFFVDSGSFKIFLPKNFNQLDININSPLNNEYTEFKKLITDLYFNNNSNLKTFILSNLEEKESRIGKYIKINTDSYIALWEIISDYTLYGYNSVYLKNLELFSSNIKSQYVYKIVVNRLKADSATIKGNEFPYIKFEGTLELNKEEFKKNSLTFIDFWSITCSPCIREMPELLKMYNKYKSKKIKFISITAESEIDKRIIAKNILNKQNIVWSNYFDYKNQFSTKLGVSAYPLYLLVDQNGYIIEKTYGDLKKIKSILNEKLK